MSGLDWGKIHERLFGYPSDQAGPPPEAPIVEQAAEDFAEAILEKSVLVNRQISAEIREAGIPADFIPYLYALLDDGPPSWPVLSSEQQQGLDLALDILRNSGDKPVLPLRVLPGRQYEREIDTALKNLGQWSQTKFRAEIIRDYAKTLQRHQGALRKLHPEIPRGSEGSVLSTYLQEALKRRPFNYNFGNLAKKALIFMFE